MMPSATVDLPTLPVLCVHAMNRLDIAAFFSVMMLWIFFVVSKDRRELRLLRTDRYMAPQSTQAGAERRRLLGAPAGKSLP